MDSSGNYSIKTKHTIGNPDLDFSNSCLSVDTSTNAVTQNVYASNSNLNFWKFEAIVPLENGVYQIQSIKNTNLYVDVPGCSTESKIMQQYAYELPPVNSNERAGLYKFVRLMDNIYLIYPMANNLNYLFTDGTNLWSKRSSRFTWKVTRDIDGNILISPATGEYTNLYVCINSNQSSGQQLQMLDVTTLGDTNYLTSSNRAKWKVTKYTEPLENMVVTVNDSHIIDMGSNISFSSLSTPDVFYSHIPERSNPGTVTFSVSNLSGTPTSLATISRWGLLTANPQKAGVVKVTATYSSGFSFSTNVYIQPPEGEYFLLQNIQKKVGYIQQNESNASKSSFTYDDNQIWQWIPYSGEWHIIKNVATGKYLASASNSLSGSNVTLDSPDSTIYNTNLWRKVTTESGRTKIQSKYMYENYPSLCLTVNSITNTLEQGNYINNSSYYDEFNVITMGNDVVYNRTFTWPTAIDPSDFISNLSKYYNTYKLIQSDIYMDAPTAQDILENAKIVVFNGHGSASVITIHEFPQRYLSNKEIYDPTDISGSLDLSNVDIVFFAGCDTGGNPCDYCDEKGKHEGHYLGCPNFGSEYYNMPKSAQYAGAKVAIGWSKTIYGNHVNDWIDRFIRYMNTIDTNTNKLHTAYEAWRKTNSEITDGNANSAVIYGTDLDFKLSN